METHLFSYRMDGQEYSFTLLADDDLDAQRRLGCIKAWGKYDGQLMATIPAYPGIGPVLSVFAAVRNWFK